MIEVSLTSETEVPSIPEPRPENVQQTLRALKEVVEVREGLRGDKLDQNVTFRDLYSAGMLNTSVLTGEALVRLPGKGLTFLPKSKDAEFAPPPAPTGLTVTGALANFILTWNAAQYHNHAYTEVWRSGSNDLGTAVRAGTTENALYADNIGDTAQLRYYWLRHVSMSGVPGPFNGTAGTSDTTLQVLTNHIADFAVTNAKIGSLAVDSAKIADAAIVTAKIGDLQVTNAKVNDLSVSKLTTGTLTAQVTLTNELLLNPGGNARSGQTAYNTGTGFWLGNDAGTPKFSIGNPSGHYLRWTGSALEVGGAIIGAGNLSISTLSAITADLGTITAGSLNINSLFIVTSAGAVTVKSATSGARLEMVGDVIRVYDSSGTLRVKMGNLA